MICLHRFFKQFISVYKQSYFSEPGGVCAMCIIRGNYYFSICFQAIVLFRAQWSVCTSKIAATSLCSSHILEYHKETGKESFSYSFLNIIKKQG